MPDNTPFALMAALGLLCALVLAGLPWFERRSPVALRTAQLALVVLAVVAYTGAGRFRAPEAFAGEVDFVNHSEQFHYQLGSKYFAEVGFDGIYAASVLAQAVLAPNIAPEATIRDLRDYSMMSSNVDQPFFAEVRARFSEARWREFVRDHREYQRAMTTGEVAMNRSDHGYNPTPFFSFVAQRFTGSAVAGPRTWTLLALLDVLLLVGAFVLTWRTFGASVACASVVVFGTGYGWRFYFNGGALLRYDWLAASFVGVCALKRGRSGLAGAAIGYATMVRVFPGALLVGPAYLVIREWMREGKPPGWGLRLAAGFGVAVAIALVAGSFSGRGPSAWLEFAEKIQLHRTSAAPNKAGAAVLSKGLPEVAAALATGTPPSAWPRRLGTSRQVRSQRIALELAIAGTLLGALAWALRRASPVQASVYGVVVLFIALELDNYYWAILALVPLADHPRTTLRIVAASALLAAMTALLTPGATATPSAESAGIASLLDRQQGAAAAVRYVVYSLCLWLLFAAWLIAAGREPHFSSTRKDECVDSGA